MPKGASRFDLETQYQEFIRAHGFDIRTHHKPQPPDTVKVELRYVRYPAEKSTRQPYDFTSTRVSDTRDTRDPQQFGEALRSRPEGTSICEYADSFDWTGP